MNNSEYVPIRTYYKSVEDFTRAALAGVVAWEWLQAHDRAPSMQEAEEMAFEIERRVREASGDTLALALSMWIGDHCGQPADCEEEADGIDRQLFSDPNST